MFMLMFSMYMYMDYVWNYTMFNKGVYEEYMEYGSMMEYSYYSSLEGMGLLMKWLLMSSYPMMMMNMMTCGYYKNKMKKSYMMSGMEGWMNEVFNSWSMLNYMMMLEYSMLPLMYMMMEEGGYNKYNSTYSMFMYTLMGSVYMLSYMMYYNKKMGTVMSMGMSEKNMSMMSMGMLMGMLMKVPVYPFQGWLPHAHVDAPSYGSMLLGGMMLKMGTYGYVSMMEESYKEVYMLCMMSMMKNSMEMVSEIDMKKMMAYSSMMHMGMGMVGLTSKNSEGMTGGMLMNMGHGWMSCGLFKVMGEMQMSNGMSSVLYMKMLKESSTKELMGYLMWNSGMPLGVGYMSEMMMMYGMYEEMKYCTWFVVMSMLLSMMYTMSLMNSMMYGKTKMKSEENKEEMEKLGDNGLNGYMMKTGMYSGLEMSYMTMWV